MKDLVIIKKEEIYTDSLVIANGISRSHDSVTKSIKRYGSHLEELGKVGLAVRASESVRSKAKRSGSKCRPDLNRNSYYYSITTFAAASLYSWV